MSNNKIEMVPYNPTWSKFFQTESASVKETLGLLLSKIHHIGSSSIPNMTAKPVIDMLLECQNVDDMPAISARLRSLGYAELRRNVIPYQSFFTLREDASMRYHLHIYAVGDPQIKRHIHFRDYVSAHPEAAFAYAELKKQLAREFQDDRFRYTVGKDKFVQAIDAQAKLWEGRRQDFLAPNNHLSLNHSAPEKMSCALAANFNVQLTHFSQYLNQVELIRIPGYTLVNSGLADANFNYILDADFTREDAPLKIADLTHYFNQRNLPFVWWVTPHDKPNNLADLLTEAGYQAAQTKLVMIMDLDSWREDTLAGTLQIVRATDKLSFADFAAVVINGSAQAKIYYAWIADVITEEDPIEFYVGYADGKPVICTLGCYYAGIAGFYNLSTISAHDQAESIAAMHQHCLKRAKQLGYHLSAWQVPREFSFLEQLGYKEWGVYREFKLGDIL